MLHVIDIHKSYEGAPLLNGVSFALDQGELIALLGPSGSGKSTLLRLIAGLEIPEAGQVLWDAADLSGVPTHQRGFGLMFQDYALFPHRSVSGNIAFGLEMQHEPSDLVDQKVSQALRSIHMEAFGGRPVTELSGGEQQRVALARALAPNPRLLMLDEPLGALDHALRVELIRELRQTLRTSATPAIYVTHDQEEAFALADRLLILHAGVIVQQGTPAAVYSQPANTWVAGFLGLGNLLPVQRDPAAPEFLLAKGGRFRIDQPLPPAAPAEALTLLLRPEDAQVNLGVPPAENTLSGKVRDCIFMGTRFEAQVETESGSFTAWSATALPEGSPLSLTWPASTILCLKD